MIRLIPNNLNNYQKSVSEILLRHLGRPLVCAAAQEKRESFTATEMTLVISTIIRAVFLLNSIKILYCFIVRSFLHFIKGNVEGESENDIQPKSIDQEGARKDRTGNLTEYILPILPSAASPSSAKRNVTFNIYEEVLGEVGMGGNFRLNNEGWFHIKYILRHFIIMLMTTYLSYNMTNLF